MLMNNYLDEIRQNISVRQNLIEMKSLMKDEKQKKALAYALAGDFSVFTELLEHEDPKVRKNAVQILGDLESDDLKEVIWQAYLKEETLFVRADYIKSLARYDCREYLQDMKDRLQLLNETQFLPEEEKHISAECTILRTLVMKYDRPRKHRFIGMDKGFEIVLMTNRNHRDITAAQIKSDKIKMLAGGVRAKVDYLEDAVAIRTYSELLFPVPGIPYLEGSPEAMAGQLIDAGIVTFLRENHEGNPPFYFRTEIKTSMPQGAKVDLLKKFSQALERQSDKQMVNSTTGYEIELRLVSNKVGKLIPFLKLFTVPDWRFYYRKEVLPTSIAPYNAALMMKLAEKYLREDAQVLDPFCGVGTMLLERIRIGKVRSLYGTDILEEAIIKARTNANQAKVPANFINRDFLDFRHEYLFDEIITNLPVAGKNRSREDIQFLYERFLDHAKDLTSDGAILAMYSANYTQLMNALRASRAYEVLQDECINEREDSHFVICRKK